MSDKDKIIQFPLKGNPCDSCGENITPAMSLPITFEGKTRYFLICFKCALVHLGELITTMEGYIRQLQNKK